MLTAREAERFKDKVEACPVSGCHLWTGALTSWGYGHLTLRRRTYKAHRISYAEAYGEIPAGMVVRHKCDTPACVNPLHLELGTDADNAADKAVRHRTPAKLTDEQVRIIRADPRKYREIAAQFGISVSAVCLIKKHQRRQHVEA